MLRTILMTSVGVWVEDQFNGDIGALLELHITKKKKNFVVLDLFTEDQPIWVDLALTFPQWRTFVIGRVYPGQDIGRVLRYATHLGVCAVVIQDVANVIEVSRDIIRFGVGLDIWIPKLHWEKIFYYCGNPGNIKPIGHDCLIHRVDEHVLVQKSSSQYDDLLQIPLQPLKDNLCANVYETFEADSIKYESYEVAINQCLLKRVSYERPVVVVVLGAGRGPLVERAISASLKTGVAIKVYAVEKNQHAVWTLKRLFSEVDQVEVLHMDGRNWDRGTVDILISELLGSFGDNELAPECLKPMERWLSSDGDCIPRHWESVIAPISSWTLWDNARKSLGHEYPYVVRLCDVKLLGKPQVVLSWSHPLSDASLTDRLVDIDIPIDTMGQTLHGFAGYFRVELAEGIWLSTAPDDHTEGMESWFPMYFPLDRWEITDSNSISLNFGRYTDDKKVWYEWCVTHPFHRKIHNVGGSLYSILKF